MSRATPQMRSIAKSVMAAEAHEDKSRATPSPAVFHVFEKLHPHFATLMGNGGFRALLSRSLALASADVPWLRAVHVKADGSLEGLEELQAQLGPDQILEGGVDLLAQMLGLLVAFIGENLTWRLLAEVWPQVSLADFNLGKGGKT